jgi:hypothetical protein
MYTVYKVLSIDKNTLLLRSNECFCSDTNVIQSQVTDAIQLKHIIRIQEYRSHLYCVTRYIKKPYSSYKTIA